VTSRVDTDNKRRRKETEWVSVPNTSCQRRNWESWDEGEGVDERE
jgi:hypothetical protein